MVVTHRLDRESSWWHVLRLIAEERSVSIVLVGSAIYMTAEQWYSSAAAGMASSVLEAGYTAPAGIGKMGMDDFERSLSGAERVLSV